MLQVLLALAAVAAQAGTSRAVPGEESAKPAWLGVFLRIAPDGGVAVVGVVPGSPAARGGLRAGDIVLSLDETSVSGPSDVSEYLRRVRPGERVRVRFLREGRAETLPIEVGASEPGPGSRGIAPPRWPRAAMQALPRDALREWESRLELLSGITLAAIPEELRLAYKAPRDAGVLVTRVSPGAAARTGLKVGDVLVKVGASAVRRPSDFHAALAGKSSDAPLEMEVVRRARSIALRSSPATAGDPEVKPEPPSRARLLREELRLLEERLREIREELEKLEGER